MGLNRDDESSDSIEEDNVAGAGRRDTEITDWYRTRLSERNRKLIPETSDYKSKGDQFLSVPTQPM